MNRLRNLRIGPRLALAFGLILLLTFIGTTVGLWQFFQVRTQAQRLNQANSEAIALLRVNNNVLKLKNDLQRLVDSRDTARFAGQADQFRNDFIRDAEQAIEILESSPIRDEEARYITQLKQLGEIASLSTQVDLIIELAQAGDWLAVQLRLENQVEQISQITQNLVDEINQILIRERAQAMVNTEQAQQNALTIIAVLGGVTLLAAGLLGFYVTRSIAHPLARLNAGAKALARREFEHRIEVSGEDELTNVGQAFNDAAAQLAELYAGLEAQVQERTDELHRRAMQLETSLAVARGVTSILDLDTLLTQVTEMIRERYGFYYVGVFLVDESGDYVVAQAGTGEAGRRLRREGVRLKIGQEGIIGWVAGKRRPARVDDVRADERYVHLEAVPNTRSELALPLAMGPQLLGVLDIQSDRVNAFRLDDVPVLQSLADQVASAIQNATLYQGEQDRRYLAETLYEAGHAISSTLDLNEVLNLILKHLASLVPYDRAAVMLQQRDELEFVAAHGFELPPSEMHIFIKKNDVFEQICETQEPLIIPDVLDRPDWQHVEGLPQARAWLGVPLIRFDKVMGMISLTRQIPDAYTPEEAQMAATFAGQAAIALENARLYDKITHFTQQLEGMVRERTEALQAAYAELEHLDRTKSDFINIAAHELRTPLTVLRGYSQMLIKDSAIKENAYLLELISTMHSGAVRLHEIVNSMLDITKIDSRALELYPEPVSMTLIIQLVQEKLEEALAERNLAFALGKEMASLPSIEADPDALEKVFYHLILNGIKYTPDGGLITISGEPRTLQRNGKAAEGIEIVVSDTGIGIDPEYHELIFTKFYQTGQLALHSSGKTKFKGAGPGLGLAIVKGIVEAHQGQIWVESPGYDEKNYPGSHFHLFLPLRQSQQPLTQPDVRPHLSAVLPRSR